jgi:hypothetical protein
MRSRLPWTFVFVFNMHRMIGKVYKSKKVWIIVRHSEDIKVVIATSNHIVFVEIMPDIVIKSHIWSIWKIFIFCDFFFDPETR